MQYDIIGDVHGNADLLTGLLTRLGYTKKLNVWQQHNHQAIFLGDLIDRGNQQLDTVNIVRKMVDTGNAQCIMGNHELNAIAWYTPAPQTAGDFLRTHSEKNRRQHRAFLAEVENRPLHQELIHWFTTLPLWLDLGNIRVVHACWNSCYMNLLQNDLGLTSDHTLTDDLLVACTSDVKNDHEASNSTNENKHKAFIAVEAICKGLEATLPDNQTFNDKDGHKRSEVRIKWWQKNFSTYREAALAPSHIIEAIPPLPFKADSRLEDYTGCPVFFGHYALDTEPQIITPRITCVDYLTPTMQRLVAYRWQGETDLTNVHFVVHKP